jgi:hypothetical protein
VFSKRRVARGAIDGERRFNFDAAYANRRTFAIWRAVRRIVATHLDHGDVRARNDVNTIFRMRSQFFEDRITWRDETEPSPGTVVSADHSNQLSPGTVG